MARSDAEESSQISREIGLPWSEALSEMTVARIASEMGQWEEAQKHNLKAVDVVSELRDPMGLNQAYRELADIKQRSGNLLKSQKLLWQCIINWKKFNHLVEIAHGLESFAYIALEQIQPMRVAHLLGAAEAVREGIGVSVFGIERLEKEYERAIGWLHTELDDSAYQTYWSEGCSMTIDQAVAYALDG